MTPSKRMAPGRPAPGWVAVASGLVVVLAYLGGTAFGGRLSPLARRPLLDGLAPPPPYHWVKPPPELSTGNRPPQGATGTLELGPSGSQVSAISTGDGQANLLMEANAIASGKPVTALAGKATVSLIFPLLPIPVTSAFDYTVLASADGNGWAKQASSVTPGSHQVASTLPAPGYVIVAVPPAPPDQVAPNRTPLLAGLAAAAAAVAVAAIVLARRLREARAEGDYDDEDDYDDDDSGEGPDHGTEERR